MTRRTQSHPLIGALALVQMASDVPLCKEFGGTVKRSLIAFAKQSQTKQQGERIAAPGLAQPGQSGAQGPESLPLGKGHRVSVSL